MAEWVAVAVMVAVPLALRVIDMLLPKGRHFKFVDRWLVEDADDEDEEEEDE